MIRLLSRNIKTSSLVFGLLLLAAAVFLGPREAKLWRLAQAREARLNHNLDWALNALERLVAGHPDDRALRIEYLETLIEAGKTTEAIPLLAALAEEEGLNYREWLAIASLYDMLRDHTQAYRLLQKAFSQAEAFLEEESKKQDRQLKYSTQKRLFWENNLAYFAYLADEDLEVRWQKLENLLKNQSVEDQFSLYRSQALRMVGRSEEAGQVVQQAIKPLSDRLQRAEKDLQQFVGFWMSEGQWPPAEEPAALSIRRNNVIEIRTMLRVLYQQAAAISVDLADVDGEGHFLQLATATHIGSNGPQFDLSAQVVARQLLEISTYLDTRGSLATKLQYWSRAQADLDAAIQASYLARAISQGIGLHNSPNLVDVRRIRLANQRSLEALAIFHYHRALLAETRGNADLAEADFQATQRLGWEPGAELN